jgi:indole-3-glycerol phosphate synthase
MADRLRELADLAWRNVQSGYYDNPPEGRRLDLSLRGALEACRGVALIAEIKFASPSRGTIRRTSNPSDLAELMARGGAVGISVLTEPQAFNGSLTGFVAVRERVDLPLLMKDLVVHESQLECARRIGANAILLIAELFTEGHTQRDLDEMIAYAHRLGLEVLLEAHRPAELVQALDSAADMIGINNRDLHTFHVDLEHSARLLRAGLRLDGRPLVVESGVRCRADIERLLALGARAFLVGSAIMEARDVVAKVRELVGPR